VTIETTGQLETSKLFQLTGRTVLVTGGAGGLGWTMACALADVGAKVFVTSNSTEPPHVGTYGTGSIRHIGFYDLSSSDGISDLISAVSEAVPQLDILVNNAGVYATTGLDDSDVETWDRMFDCNLKAVFFLTQGMIPLLKRAAEQGNRSRIINIGSVVGRFPASIVPYAISKSGVHHLTSILAGQLAKSGINVNAIAPGAFRTRMTEEALDAMGEEFEKSIPVGRIGAPSDIAATTVFLASAASEFLTGHVLPLDGGYADLLGVSLPE